MNDRQGPPAPAILQALLAASMDAVLALDADSRIVVFNEMAEHLFGCRATEALGSSLERFVPSRYRQSHARSVDAYRDGALVVPRRMGKHREIWGLRADGAEFPAEASIARVESDGAVWVVVTVRDVSDRLVAEARVSALNESLGEQVDERTAALERSLGELETFCYRLAHDLRAPLRAIDGYAQMVIEDEPGLAPDSRKHLESSRAGAQRMAALLDGLTAYARLAKAELSDTLVDLGEVAREVVDGYGAAGEIGHAQVDLGPLPTVRGDRRLLREALAHLVSNALKFSAKTPVPRVQVGGAATAAGVEVYVKDNGAGFDPAQADKLFGVFQRLHHPADYPGAGVGLAMVRRIAELHGASVAAEGEPGRGATFRIILRPAGQGPGEPREGMA